MKRLKLIGIVLILVSLFIQVTYAATVTFADVSNGDYNIRFKKVDYYINENSQYLKINIQKTDDYNLAIDIKDLYPGAYFTIRPHISNYGYKDVKIVGLELIYISGNKSLFDNIVGINSAGTEIDKHEYFNLLNEHYKDTLIGFGETIEIEYSLGLSKEVQDLMNEEVIFEIKVVYGEPFSNTDVKTNNLNDVYNTKLDDLISIDKAVIPVNSINKLSVSDNLSPQNVYLAGLTMVFAGAILLIKGR